MRARVFLLISTAAVFGCMAQGQTPVITGLRRISRPGRRVYVGIDDIPPIRKGLGVNVLSTPKGILVDREAKKAKVGSQVL